MNHKGTIKLETERLILRRFVMEDAKAMYENWASEDEVTKWWGQEIMPEAGRVMQKIDMTYEGTLRSAGFCNQGVIDDVWYSILKEEFMR